MLWNYLRQSNSSNQNKSKSKSSIDSHLTPQACSYIVPNTVYLAKVNFTKQSDSSDNRVALLAEAVALRLLQISRHRHIPW
jgi:hypothetical protein